jgi:hypothetical protein
VFSYCVLDIKCSSYGLSPKPHQSKEDVELSTEEAKNGRWLDGEVTSFLKSFNKHISFLRGKDFCKLQQDLHGKVAEAHMVQHV